MSIEDVIDKEYNYIMLKIKGGTLYGIPINDHLDDLKFMIVAAYGAGIAKCYAEKTKAESMNEWLRTLGE